MRIPSLLLLILLISCPPVIGQQNYSSKSSKAIGYFEKARECYNKRDDDHAVEYLEKAITEDQGFVEPYIALADIYRDQGKNDLAIKYLTESIKLNPSFFPGSYYNLADLYYAGNNYVLAAENYNLFLETKPVSQKLNKAAKKKLANCRFAIQATAHPVPFKPVSLGDSVNSTYDEYWPSLSADEHTLVITRRLPVSHLVAPASTEQEDFYVSNLKDGHWSLARDMGSPLNTDRNEGAQSLSSDGMVMFFTACDRPDGEGMCDIYVSVKRLDKWDVPFNLGPPVNTRYSEKQPSISPDGHALYFVSDRPGGKGGYDIYVSKLNEDGQWGTPVNLGDSINTVDNEQSPFIAMDNQTLYFSSQGWPGLGGYDLFVSRKKPDSTWSTPVNLGYPINTAGDEIGLIVNAEGNRAYFASNREGSKQLDIFSFDLYRDAQPIPVSYMKGMVYDSETGAKLAARFELIDLASGKLVSQAVSNNVTGTFLVTIPAEKDYALNVSKEGYLFYSDHFELKGIHDAQHPFLKDVPLKPIQLGESVVLRNIFFETDSYRLKDESLVELNKLLEFLSQNPTVKIEIGGYTDYVGSDQYNQKLSENRAGEVKSFLVTHGVASERIIAKGYGKSKPVAGNDTEEGRAQNRRTEFRIISR